MRGISQAMILRRRSPLQSDVMFLNCCQSEGGGLLFGLPASRVEATSIHE